MCICKYVYKYAKVENRLFYKYTCKSNSIDLKYGILTLQCNLLNITDARTLFIINENVHSSFMAVWSANDICRVHAITAPVIVGESFKMTSTSNVYIQKYRAST